jgi:hypothetical protein
MLIPKRITRRLRTAWLLLTFLPGALTTLAQSPCNLKFDQLTPGPELFGFHLGMTLEQVTARVPQVRFPKESAEAAAAAVVIGDQRTKLYYPNDCDEADKVPEANRLTFKDKDTAEKAGYKRAKDCP